MTPLLSRLTHALALCRPDESWVFAESDVPLVWPEDLPPLPDDLRQALQWRSCDGGRGVLFLPTLSLPHWQDLAERLRTEPGRFPLDTMGLALDARGVFQGDAPVADSLAELVELEALIHERLPYSYARRVRIGEGMPEWQPSPELTPEQLDACEVGTALCARQGLRQTFAVQVGPGLWATERQTHEPLPDGFLVGMAAMEKAQQGDLHPRPLLKGSSWWRSTLPVWQRPSLSELLDRLQAALPELLPPEHELPEDLPAELRALWERTGGSEEPLTENFVLLGPSAAAGWDEPVQEGLIPMMVDAAVDLSGAELSEAELVCLDTRGEYALPGALVQWSPSHSERTVLFETLQDWLEAVVLQREREYELPNWFCPRGLPRGWRERTGARRPEPEPTPLSRALDALLEPGARALVDSTAIALVRFSWGDQPEGPPSLAVLRDWLHDRGLSIGKATLATLVTRAVPLLAVP